MKTSKIHISLNVRDVEASTRWYGEFFGQEPHKVRPGYANFDVESLGLKLALNHSGAFAEKGSLNHLGILVENSNTVWDTQKRLMERGFDVRIEEGVECCHATQDKFWVNDPDGNEWEVYTILNDNPGPCCENDAQDAEGPCCKQETCCQ